MDSDMSAATIAKTGEIVAGEVLSGGVSFADRLASGETITGATTATVTQIVGATDADGITTSAVAANDATVTIDGTSVVTGEAVIFTVTAAADAVSGCVYQVLVSAATAGQTLKERVNVTII